MRFAKLAKDMIETMDKTNGSGIAAPQVGKSIRMFVLRDYIIHEDEKVDEGEPKVFINPKISSPGEYFLTETGRVSIDPGTSGLEVDRPDRIYYRSDGFRREGLC